MLRSLLLLGRPGAGLAREVAAITRTCLARTERIRRLTSLGGIGWHLSEQVCGLGWGRAAFLVIAVLAAVAAVAWLATRLRPVIMI